MENQVRKLHQTVSFLINRWKPLLSICLFLSIILFNSSAFAQSRNVVKGIVTDEQQNPSVGATVSLKGNTKVATVADGNGKFTISIPNGKQTLIVSFIGMESKEIEILGSNFVTVVLKSNSIQLGETIVVGYGTQRKASVVGSITQVTGKIIEKTGGVTSLGEALTGNLPGVTTMQTTGKPGQEDPQIIVRGISSWNNSNPLILVDGIERQMNSVDITSVESISVLKDASATAVYGVRGANGVILITTRRGQDGKAKIEVGYSATMKSPSLLPGKMDSYDALEVKNRAIEYELSQDPISWGYMNSQSFINNYRNQTTQAQKERYPNIDWQKLEFKNYTMSHNANINISGGTKFVKYFTAVDYVNEGDIVKLMPNNKGYESGYDYNRVNSRANLDFQLTKTTKFLINLSGSYGKQKAPMNVITEGYMWAGAYNTPPDLYYPQYSDGAWGWCPTNQVDGANSAMNLALGGAGYTTTTQIASDFTLNQDLGFLIKGLSAKAAVSLDNRFVEAGRGINNGSSVAKQEYINPYTGLVSSPNTPDGLTNFDYYPINNWTTGGGSMTDGSTFRNLNYSAQLFYQGDFGNHKVTAMGNAARQEQSTGGALPSYREDWVFRTTYAFKDKYFIEYNGAYNGSEKFAPANRFAFFSSGALGWMVSQEKFMKSLKFLDMLKLRVSYGQIGDDNINGRWLYMDQTNNYTSQTPLTTVWTYQYGEVSPYKWYSQTQIGNPSISWEKVTKKNLGADFSIFKHLFSGSVDIFQDYRTNIVLPGSSRSVPSYFGFTPPSVNVGAVKVHGYEIELKYSQNILKDLHFWINVSMTRAVDKVINKDDPALYPEYLKAAGYPNNQSKSTISEGYYNTWDQLYGSTAFASADTKIPGNYRILDFDCDGVIDPTKDNVRYGYPTNPQNTYNATIGIDWKGFSCFAQFYAVNDVSRYIQVQSFSNGSLPFFNNVYTEGSYWSLTNENASSPMPRINNQLNSATQGTRYLYDGSYVRLKNAEIAYTFTSNWIKKVGLQALRIYVNGNDLVLWTHTPDDREINGSTAYPTVKRYNFGLKVNL